MTKILFLPLSIGAGLLAGLIGKKIFQLTWGVIDDQGPPQSEHRHIDLRKLALSLAIEGALFRVVKGFVDHASRHGFTRITGVWPGDEEPQPK